MLSLNNTTNSARHSTHFPFCYKMNQSINQPTRERMKDRPCLQTNLKRGKKKSLGVKRTQQYQKMCLFSIGI